MPRKVGCRVIGVDAVGYRVGAKELVREVSLAVEPGQVLALVGPNGAGKSTLLRLIAGEIVPTSGTVRFGMRPLSSFRPRELARRRAVLSQASELTFPVPCVDVVMLGRTPHSESGETRHDQAIARLALGSTGTLGFSERAYPSLSGGERKRVDAARCFAQIWEGPSARALLLDEPTAGLDLAQQHALLSFTRELAEEACAVLCVLHDLNLAAQYADQIAVMAGGALVALGSPRDVLTRGLLADVFKMDAAILQHPELSCPVVVCHRPALRNVETIQPLVPRGIAP